MSVRIRRLQAEYERLKVAFDGHPHISIAEVFGRPPNKYVVEYRLKGLVEVDGEIRERDLHRAEITFGADYPREMPRCVMLTPVFHPNIDHLAICTKDIGSPGETLDQTIIFIGEMISFQAYNLRSPRNGDAARWTAENLGRLPLTSVDLVPHVLLQGDMEAEVAVAAAAALLESRSDADAPSHTTPEPPRDEERISVVPSQPDETAATATPYCANCKQTGPAEGLAPCANQHLTCADCRLSCDNCMLGLCCMCVVRTCVTCRKTCCEDCAVVCQSCGHWGCLTHVRRCGGCGLWQCVFHISAAGQCAACARAAEYAGASRHRV